MYCIKLNDTSTQCVSLYLDVTHVLTAIFRNVLQVLKMFQPKCFFYVAQNVFSRPLLVDNFHLVCNLFKLKKKSRLRAIVLHKNILVTTIFLDCKITLCKDIMTPPRQFEHC